MQIYVNYLTVLAAAFASTLLGMIWYSHPIFGNLWKKYMGWTEDKSADQKNGIAKRYSISLLSSFVKAFVMAYFIKLLGITGVSGAFIISIWFWLGFIATTEIHSVLWEKKPWGLYFLNTFYNLFSFFLMALILAFFG
jgi:hypothetical protein